MKAINDVAVGEELYVTYLDSSLGYHDRQHRLWDSWGFKCDCAYCRADSHPDEEISTRNTLMRETGRKLFELCNDLWHQIDAASSGGDEYGKQRLEFQAKHAIMRLHTFRKQLDRTYARGRRVKLEDSDALLLLGLLHQATDPQKALQVHWLLASFTFQVVVADVV